MAINVIDLVWELDLPPTEKYILIAYVDHSDKNGESIFPSLARVAWKTGKSKRSVQDIRDKLKARGILVEIAPANGTARPSTASISRPLRS